MVNGPILHNRPLITAEDRAAVDVVLHSEWIAQGRQVKFLEDSFVRRYAGGGACAVSSGTAALYLAIKALGIGVGEKVAVPTYSCSALLNAIHFAGGTPSIVDVLPESFCLSPDALDRQAPDAACVIAVHTNGAPADIESLRKAGRKLIEDCCQSLGGESDQKLIGGKGDAAIFSFYATKIITGGQGGLIWSKNESVTNAVHDYRQFDCRESYIPRFNFQLTDIQAALINSQMRRLDEIRAHRMKIVSIYIDALPRGFSLQSGLTDNGRMAYRCVVLAPDLETREGLRRHMERAGVSCIVPIERYELLHRYLKLDPFDFPVAEHLVDTTLSLPIYPGLTEEQVVHVATALKKFKL